MKYMNLQAWTVAGLKNGLKSEGRRDKTQRIPFTAAASQYMCLASILLSGSSQIGHIVPSFGLPGPSLLLWID